MKKINNNDKENIMKICEEYEWTEDEYISQLINRANLSCSEQRLFKMYAIDCNSNYNELARKLNGSKYIVRKEIHRIRKKIIKTNNKF